MSTDHFERACLHALKAVIWLTFEQPARGAAESERVLCLQSSQYRSAVVSYMKGRKPNVSKIAALTMHCFARGNQWSAFATPQVSFAFLSALCFSHFATMTYAVLPLVADVQAVLDACNCHGYLAPCLAALMSVGNAAVAFGLKRFQSSIPMVTIVAGECILAAVLLWMQYLADVRTGVVSIACVLALIGASNGLIWSQLSTIAACKFPNRYLLFRGVGTMGSLAACLCIHAIGTELHYFLAAHGAMIIAVASILTPKRLVQQNKAGSRRQLRLDRMLKVAVACVSFCETIWGFLAFVTLTAILRENGLVVLQVAGFTELVLLIGILPFVLQKSKHLRGALFIAPVGWATVSLGMHLSVLCSWCALVCIVCCVNVIFFALILRDLPRKTDQLSVLHQHAIGAISAFLTIAVSRSLQIEDYWLWSTVLMSALVALVLMICRHFTNP